MNTLEEFRSLGIEFISLYEGVDTSTPNGRLVFGIFASIAEFERELIRDRVRSGIADARSNGKKLGRPRVSVDASKIATLRAEALSLRCSGQTRGIQSVPFDVRAACGKTRLRWLPQGLALQRWIEAYRFAAKTDIYDSE